MADAPLTWAVVQGFAACLRRVTRSAGYRTDIGLDVFDEPAKLLAHESDECCAVNLDTLARSADPALRKIGRDVVIVVSAKVPHDLENREVRIHDVLDDIDRALADRARDFPLAGAAPEFLSAAVDPRADGLAWVGVQVRYSVSVRRAR